MDALRDYELLLETTSSPARPGKGFSQDSFTFSQDGDDSLGQRAGADSMYSGTAGGALYQELDAADISNIPPSSTANTTDIIRMGNDVPATTTPSRKPYSAPVYEASTSYGVPSRPVTNVAAALYQSSEPSFTAIAREGGPAGASYMSSRVIMDTDDGSDLPSDGSYSVPPGLSDAGVSSVNPLDSEDQTVNLSDNQGFGTSNDIALPEAFPATSYIARAEPERGISAIGTDVDAETLSQHLDAQAAAYKKDVMNHFLQVKTRILQEHDNDLASRAQTHANEQALKQEEIENLKEDMAALLEIVNRTEVVKLHMAATLGKRALAERMRQTARHAFATWRANTVGVRVERQRMDRAQRFHERALLRRSLARWRKSSRVLHKNTLQRRLQQRLERKEHEVGELYKEEIAIARRELADAHELVNQERAMRAQLEENLKKAFMRGVCALNMEAMAIMKDPSKGGAGGSDMMSQSVLDATRDMNASVAWSQVSGTQPLNYTHLGIGGAGNGSLGADVSSIARNPVNVSAAAALPTNTIPVQPPSPIRSEQPRAGSAHTSPIRGSREHSAYINASLDRDLTAQSAVSSHSRPTGKRLSSKTTVVRNKAVKSNSRISRRGVGESDEHPRAAAPHPSQPLVVREKRRR